jgi:hypothetical protein
MTEVEASTADWLTCRLCGECFKTDRTAYELHLIMHKLEDLEKALTYLGDAIHYIATPRLQR